MSLVIPAGFAQITYLFDGPGTPTGAAVTIGVENATGLDPTAIATAAQVAYNTELGPYFDDDFNGDTIRVKLGPNSTGVSADVTAPFSGAAADSDPEPPNTALLVQKRTLLGGRSGRGRMYWPGLTSTQVVNGAIAPATVTALQAAFEDWAAILAGAFLTPVLFHDELSPVLAPTEITSLEVQGIAATQRRRLRR